MTEERWYVLYCRPRAEKKLSDYLSKLSFRHYLPMVARKRQWSDRVKMVDFPLFPGYVFIYMDWQKRLEALRHSVAVAFIKDKDGSPGVMQDQEIENLKIFVAAAGDIESRSSDEFPPGKKVRFHTGPFKDMEGIVHKAKNKTRLYVYLPLIGQMASTEIDVKDIENAWQRE